MGIRDGFIVRSELGVFAMERLPGDGKCMLEGKANGFDLLVEIREGGKYAARCMTDSERWAAASTGIEGAAPSEERIPDALADWVDGLCPQAVEEYADDVRYLKTRGGRIAYYAYNTHLKGTPAVFVHGGPGGECNPPKARRLMLDRPVYTYDQSGCGRSEKIRDLSTWTLDDYVNELSDFVDSIGSPKVILIGASWGAGLCAAYAESTKCAKVAAMVLPSPFVSSEIWNRDQMENLKDLSPEMYNEMTEIVGKKDFGERYRQIMSEYYARYLFCRKKNREIALANADVPFTDVFTAMWGPHDIECTGTLRDFDVTPGLKDISVPVLFMCGDSDQVRPETMLRYRSMVRGSRLSVIPFAGHVLAFEQFALYRESITAFLDEIDV